MRSWKAATIVTADAVRSCVPPSVFSIAFTFVIPTSPSMKLNVPPMDLRIAATVLQHGGVLVTRNRRDFAQFCKDRTVLDACCYTGGFAVAAKAGGAVAIGIALGAGVGAASTAPSRRCRMNAPHVLQASPSRPYTK